MRWFLSLLCVVLLSNIGTYYSLTHLRSIHVKDIKIATVDLSEIRNTAEVYKLYMKLVEDEFKKAQKKILVFENKLRDLDTEIKDLLQKNDPKKSKELKVKRELFFKQKQESEKNIMQIKEKLNSYFEKQGDKIQLYLEQALDFIIKKHNINMLLNAEDKLTSRVVLYADRVLEITDEVKNKFNQITKDFKFEEIE